MIKSGNGRSGRGRSLLIAAAMLAGVAGWSVEPQGAEQSRRPSASEMSNFGSYLAGRYAQNRRDLTAAAEYVQRVLATDPDNPQLLRRAYFLMASEGRMTEAETYARRIVDGGAETALASLTLALADIKAGRFAEAEKHLAAIERNRINNLISPLLRGWTKIGQTNLDAGLEALKPVGQDTGLGALYQMHQGFMNDLAGRFPAAEQSYLRARQQAGEPSQRMITAIGNFYERQGERAKAEAIYQEFGQRHPESPMVEAAMARLRAGSRPERTVRSPRDGIAEGLTDVAGALIDARTADTALIYVRMALDLRPDFDIGHILLGEVLEAQGRNEQAAQAYRAVPAKSPYAWNARLRIAGNLEALNETDRAIAELKAMAAERPRQPDPLVRAGDILRTKERYAEAVPFYDQAISRLSSIETQHWSLFYSRGIVLERSKQWPRAEGDFLKALELQPEQAYVLNYLGYSWVEQGVNLDRAKGMIEKAVALRPQDGYIVDSLGWVLYRLGDFEGAVRHLERAIELRPQDPVINDHLGDAYWRVGRRTEARVQWRRALSLKPEPDVVGQIEGKLQNGLQTGDEPRKGG
ncbi:MAG: tetratricopeptide repeat protein [Alphaproteobacteria bacterium]|nr:tetratricopeptide repeat protein [Alphaproteobacteria bacterium]